MLFLRFFFIRLLCARLLAAVPWRLMLLFLLYAHHPIVLSFKNAFTR
jgi:hypothetical protein